MLSPQNPVLLLSLSGVLVAEWSRVGLVNRRVVCSNPDSGIGEFFFLHHPPYINALWVLVVQITIEWIKVRFFCFFFVFVFFSRFLGGGGGGGGGEGIVQ